MEKFEKILVLNNEFEAERLEEVLKDRGIPYGIVPSADSVFEGINQLEWGWGYVEAPEKYGQEILEIYAAQVKD
jgi:hypothetical protein